MYAITQSETTIQSSPAAGRIVHPAYRADIDGLRAVAVLGVVGFHAFPAWLPGGFVGVDVFFVISGFLISTILFRTFDRGAFSFADFYGRRIKRIFPSLVVVLIAAYAIGWWSLLADEYRELGKHIAASAGFAANFVFWRESGYFDTAADAKPLLHLWSLGIEEQFYAIWPVAVYAVCRFRFNRRLFLAGSIVVSFWLNLFLMSRDPAAAFYLPAARWWELSIGGLLATGWMQSDPDRAAMRGNICGAIGVALVLWGIARLRPTDHFPGWWALLPTAGAALVIVAGPRAWPNRAVLARRVLVAVGLISYPLYLWHWPLLSFLRIVEATAVPWTHASITVLLSVALAAATYRVAERPIRGGGHVGAKVAALCLVMAAVGATGYHAYAHGGLPARIPPVARGNDRATRMWKLNWPNVFDCSAILRSIPSSLCASHDDPRVAVLGDSHAGHLFGGLIRSGDVVFERAMMVMGGSCWATSGVELRKGCNDVLRIALDRVAHQPRVDVVIIGGYYDFDTRLQDTLTARLFVAYRQTIRTLQEMGKTVLFVSDTPTLKRDPDICLRVRPIEVMFPSLFQKPAFCDGATPADLRSHATYDTFVDALQVESPGVFFYDPFRALCTPEGVCRVFADGRLLYIDWNHLSIYGSDYVVRDLISQFNAASVGGAPRQHRTLRYGSTLAKTTARDFAAAAGHEQQP